MYVLAPPTKPSRRCLTAHTYSCARALHIPPSLLRHHRPHSDCDTPERRTLIRTLARRLTTSTFLLRFFLPLAFTLAWLALTAYVLSSALKSFLLVGDGIAYSALQNLMLGFTPLFQVANAWLDGWYERQDVKAVMERWARARKWSAERLRSGVQGVRKSAAAGYKKLSLYRARR